MSDKGLDREWEEPLVDQTYPNANVGLLQIPGKSQSPVVSDIDTNIVANRMKLERLRLQQLEADEEFSYQLKKLELERAKSRANFEKEIARLESTGLTSNRKIDEEVLISDNLNARFDDVSLIDVIRKIDLPKIELPYFDGDSSHYHFFIREFENQIESRVKEDSQRLSYLLHYCRGRAKRAISGCVMLPGSQGYSNARDILANMFGQAHVVAKCLLEKLTSGKSIRNSSDELWELSIEMQNCSTTLNQMSYVSDLNCHVTIERVVRRLPLELQQRWVEKASEIYESNREPSFQDLIEFVTKRARVAGCRYNFSSLQRPDAGRPTTSNLNIAKTRESLPNRAFTNTISEPVLKCPLCSSDHSLDNCKVFISMSVGNRRRFVSRTKRCFICLLTGHVASDCKCIVKCGIRGCLEDHHKMLHKDKTETDPISVTGNVGRSIDSYGKVSLGVVAVKVVGPRDIKITYALIDNGADSTFISQKLANEVGLHGEDASVTIRTLNSVKSQKSSKVSFVIEPVVSSNQINVDRAFIMPDLNLGTADLLSGEQLKQWRHLEDVEITNVGPSEIELLIGCNVPEAHWVFDQKLGSRNQPFAIKTVLGWMLLGPVHRLDSNITSTCLLSSCQTIQEQLSRLYNHEFEDVSDDQSLSIDDIQAVKQVSESIRLENGHFVVGLPWKSNKRNLPDNHNVAYRRLMLLKKRFASDLDLFKKYADLVQRHFEMGYAVPVPKSLSNTGIKWYLPHHPVLNPKKPGKVRIVFDCAAKHLGVSLNDCLLQGPNMIQNLVAVLTRFRQGKFALIGDIREMFLQVKVPEIDRNVLRFLWWDQGDIARPIREFQLTVHPFGAVSSPFCASFALRQCANLCHNESKPIAIQTLQNNFYVDDCLLSCDSELELIGLQDSLVELLSKAGFHLTKWMSNSKEVLKRISIGEHTKPTVDLNFQELQIERTLGLQWDAQCDCFKFDVDLPSRPLTRRGILSCISSLYDPLGLVCPVLLPAKQILQELCRLKYGWDDPITADLAKSWRRWLNSVEKLRELEIPRCIKPKMFESGAAPELHVFSDASERGYGVAAYARFEIGEGRYQCNLIIGKSRVAPLKSISVPRLELSATVLAVKVADLILRENLLRPSRTYFWTDSMTVLYYLANTSSRFATFVSNRITYITERFSKEQWMFVKGSENPADHASRGIAPDDPRFETWLRGPKFLESTFKLPETPNRSEVPEGCEFKAHMSTLLTSVDSRMNAMWTHYSSWHKLQRAIVWLTRFKSYLSVIHCVRPDSFVTLGPIKLSEIERATKDIITLVQREEFAAEIDQVVKYGRCANLAKMNPVLCDGILVLGGRLSHPSDLSSGSHKPILPGRHAVTKLIIRYYHELEGHAGLQQVLSTSRRHFWILKGAASVKRVLNDCPKCKYQNARPREQQMARLPECRITPGTYAFESCGVDYFGPLLVQQGRSVIKRWGCLFTCMRSRAVHIEVVHTLSTDSFLMAILRFVSRRGCPKEIFSDNGSNFVGADSELRRQLELSKNKINDCLLAKGIQWHFQPPGSSHRGGVWERLIKSVRKILRSISDKCAMKDEVLLTLLTEVEGIMNNRPLIPVYDDSRDALALTPNDLLLLRSIDPVVSDTSIDVRRYTKWWKQAWQLSNLFWKRWVRDYLPTLELRQKWYFPKRNLKVGDVVLVVNEVGNKSDWPLGRIVATHPGDDGLVRKVDVATKKGIIQRDVRKVCLLEGEMG